MDMNRSTPTAPPPSRADIASDLRARAKRLEQMSQQLAREASELFFAAMRMEKDS